MNVKPGDIAFVVAGVPENLGRLVRVECEHGLVDYAHKGYDHLFCWVVTPFGGLVRNVFGETVKIGYIPDLALRALPEPTPGELMDEALDELGEVMRVLAAKNPQGWK
jgi:hypothetical protein